MSVRWNQSDGGIVIHQKGSLVARAFGVPFLAAGLVMLWHFVTGLLGFVDPTQGQLTAAGFVLLPIFILAFGAPGWILVLGRKRTEVDRAARSVLEVRDFLIYRLRETSPVPEGSVVRARLEETPGPKRATVLLLVEVAPKTEPPIQIAVFNVDETEPARELAMAVAGSLGLPLVDDLDKGPTEADWEDEEDEEDE